MGSTQFNDHRGLSLDNRFEQTAISPSPNVRNAHKLKLDQRKKVRDASSHRNTMYSLAHGDPFYRRTDCNVENMPTYEEMKARFSSISKSRYDEIMAAKPYAPKHTRSAIRKNESHKGNILASPFN